MLVFFTLLKCFCNQIKPALNVISQYLNVFVNITKSFSKKLQCIGFTIRTTQKCKCKIDCFNEFKLSYYPSGKSITKEQYYCYSITFSHISYCFLSYCNILNVTSPLNHWYPLLPIWSFNLICWTPNLFTCVLCNVKPPVICNMQHIHTVITPPLPHDNYLMWRV